MPSSDGCVVANQIQRINTFGVRDLGLMISIEKREKQASERVREFEICLGSKQTVRGIKFTFNSRKAVFQMFSCSSCRYSGVNPPTYEMKHEINKISPGNFSI